MLQPDASINWELFQSTFSNISSYKRPTVINQMFHKDFAKKVVQWEGTVLRVDSFDEVAEYITKQTDMEQSLGKNKSFTDFKPMAKYSNDEVRHSGLYAAQVLIRMDTRFFLK